MVYTGYAMGYQFIGAIATQSRVPIKTIRYYEEIGLLSKPPRTTSRYRLYPPEVVSRLQFIKKAQHLGLQLKQVKEIVDLADRGRCPCGHVQRLLRRRLQELRRKIDDLRLIERRMAQAVRRGCPPRVKPRGKAICPTIDRQRIEEKT